MNQQPQMFHRTSENLHYQSLFFEIGRSVLVLARHKYVSSSAAAMCCTGCPSESPGTFNKNCCLKKWSLGARMRFRTFFYFGCVLKLTTVSCATWAPCFQQAPVSFPCDSDLGWCLQPGFPLGPDPQSGSEIPAPVFQPRVGLHWCTARGCQQYDNNSTGMCYLRLWDLLLQNIREINNLARFIFGFSVIWKQDY